MPVKTRTVLCLMGAVSALSLWGCSDSQQTVDTNVSSPVSVEEVTKGSIEEFVTATGTVNPTQEALMTSEAEGYYRLAKNPRTGKPFAIGDQVKKDDIIIYIDNPEQENSIALESQELNLDISKSEFEKQQSLYEKGGVTLRELKDAERSFIDARYSHENALFQLAKLKVAAPFDGVIVDLPYHTPGVKVGSGEDMVHIMNYRHLNMEISLPGKSLGSVVAGQQVRVMNYTLPDKFFAASIDQVAPVLDVESRTYKAVVDVDNPDLLLRPGMFVKAEVVTARSDSSIVIPREIVHSRRNMSIVYVVERGTAIERPVTLGLENPDQVEIKEGLSEGERLVVDGYEALRHNAKVTIVQ